MLLLFSNIHTRASALLSAPCALSARRLLTSAAAAGSLAVLAAPAQAAHPLPRPALSVQATHAAHLAHQHAAKAHLAQQARTAALQGKALRVQAASAKLMHARKMALLKSVLGQQHLAIAEVKTQRTLTAQAQKLALRQQTTILRRQKLALAARKAQVKLAALRHQSLVRLAKLQTQHGAAGSGNVVMAAYALRGSRYVMGGTSRSGFDCSGFVRYVLSTTDGVSIPRTAAEQYYRGLPIPVQSMEPGDLVFFKNTYKRGISHVGIYAGQGKFIHAANSHKGVRMDLLNAPYYWSHFAGARRVLPSVMRQAAFLR